jgi:glycosyltransferase involved in cell wall biosynthesis
MWVDMFSAICRWQYRMCDQLITLTQINKSLQVDYGADPETITVVPNGIKIDRFKKARKPRCIDDTKTVAFVGRVDSVKDVKTYIQSISVMKKRYPEIKSLIIGPYDEQPGYYEECRQLIRMLDLAGTITFTGRADVLDYYKQIDLLLLTSIKEAMPLVVMEAMASGIPVVATSVGACEELLFGNDDGIGPAGSLARVMDAEGIADASIRILKNPGLADKMARNGISRIERHYREEFVIDQYSRIYQEALNGGRHLSP